MSVTCDFFAGLPAQKKCLNLVGKQMLNEKTYKIYIKQGVRIIFYRKEGGIVLSGMQYAFLTSTQEIITGCAENNFNFYRRRSIMNMKQSGFTLIELMIVVAILALLAAIALPTYRDYYTRAQTAEGYQLAGGQKVNVVEYYDDTGNYPTNNTEAGMPANTEITGKYVSTVTVASGAIVAEFKASAAEAISGETLVLSPISHQGSVEWRCKSTAIAPQYLPRPCR